jgi:hypothetical protein
MLEVSLFPLFLDKKLFRNRFVSTNQLQELKSTVPWQIPYENSGTVNIPIPHSNTIKFEVVQ